MPVQSPAVAPKDPTSGIPGLTERLRAMVPALSAPDFRRYWTAQLLSLTGTWMQSAAQAWLVLQLTKSPFALGLIGTLQFAPMLFFSLLAGALIDRVPKRRLLLVTQSFLALQAVLLGILTLTGVVQYWHIAVLALCLGLANTLDMPGRQAFVREMVQRKDLVMNAIALNSTVFNIARVLGPGVAGILITVTHIGWVFILNALTFLPVILAMHRVSAGRAPAQSFAPPVIQSIGEGLRYVRQNVILSRALLLLLLVSVFSINFNVIVPVFAERSLKVDARGYGFLMSALGAGAIAGATGMVYLSRFGPRREFVYIGAIGLGMFQCLLPTAKSVAPAAVILVLTGACMILFISTINTMLQVNSADEYRGRVMSLYTLVFGGSTPIGNPVIGWISEHLGVSHALLFGGGAGMVFTAIYATARTYSRRKNHAS
ncbi:MAG: MFS transporter [bacterium JZ-2024 1]